MKKLATLTLFLTLIGIGPARSNLNAQNTQNDSSTVDVSININQFLSQNFVDKFATVMESKTTWTGDPPTGGGATGLYDQGSEFDYDFNHLHKNFDTDHSINFGVGVTEKLSPTLSRSLEVSFSRFNRNKRGVINSEGLYSRWVKLWDANLRGKLNTQDPGQEAIINYWANDSFRRYAAKALIEKSLDLGDYRASLHAGVTGSLTQYERTLGQEQMVFFDYHVGNRPGTYNFTNLITIESTSSSDIYAAGPVVGVSVSRAFDSFALTGKVTTAPLYTYAEYEGRFHDVDDIKFTNPEDKTETVVLDGLSTYLDEDQLWTRDTNISVTAETELWGVTTNLGLNVNFWSNVPLIPTLHRPWGRQNPNNAPGGLDWRVKKRNLDMTTIFLSLSYPIN